ncbi:hypothetical protein KVR01_009528 [Diaporthe batatas]|uniref:uncharacterized protein n=1 Tax=Diaporthe batatas TaxID=748121 RepID=UPI001D03BDBA|nr:uncharacterized protein KVR01_009528 [Diaporthe batatas]KAG8161264.1 hypothetical protein KVR01_009528 [Diaporthe batatas]
MVPTWEVRISSTERVFAATPAPERLVALSLLDATTANFSFTSALWLLERPAGELGDGFSLVHHLRSSLRAALEFYPWWCGRLKSVTSLDGTVEDETAWHIPRHARRYGRVYAQYGVPDQDPGVEFIAATSSATLDDLYQTARPQATPLWNQTGLPLNSFGPSTNIASALEANEPVAGKRRPLLALQVTELACGGIALAVKGAHPLADITSLVRFVKDWASLSRSALDSSTPSIEPVVLDPELLDSKAAGDINADEAVATIIRQAESLPLHRYDWWTSPGGPAWATKKPSVFPEDLAPAGRPIPWSEWDFAAPVSTYIIHFHRAQIDHLWKVATKSAQSPNSIRISKHDAILAHIWSCIVRARQLEDDPNPVHCDLVLGVRPALKLSEAFMGSPIIMVNIEMAGSDVAFKTSGSGGGENKIAKCIRETLIEMSNPENMAAHLHSVAYEKSPQRLWQAFLGRRHILVTTWARAGIYDVDFGLGSGIRYADAVLPAMDGGVLVKEGPSSSPHSWTDNGVDVTVHLRTEDMERLVLDPQLLPACT